LKNILNITKIGADLFQFFDFELARMAQEQGWEKDSQWTNGIHQRLAEIGHKYGVHVFANPNRCRTADGCEWLYDHHWRLSGKKGELIKIPLVVEIEWGFGAATIFKKITEDFLKLVQARADVRVMVFHCNDVPHTINKLIAMVKSFKGSQQGDNWLFAGWDWDTDQMQCIPWTFPDGNWLKK